MSSRSVLRVVLGAAAAALAMIALAKLSAAPIGVRGSENSRIRISWTARPERIETCRVLSKKELEQREEHMRQRVECEGRFATYLLQIFVDGRAVQSAQVQGGGLRHDRPIFLLRDADVVPGLHRLSVHFTRREKTDNDAAAFTEAGESESDTGLFAGRAQREAVEHARRARAAIPPVLHLDTLLTFERGRVTVITLDAERATLVLLR